jgi:hypothetical protein
MCKKPFQVTTVYSTTSNYSVSCQLAISCTFLPCAPLPRLISRPIITLFQTSCPDSAYQPREPYLPLRISFPVLCMQLLLISHKRVEFGSFRMVESLKICSTPRVAAAASACHKQGGANHSAHYPSRAKRQSPIPIPRVCQRIRATRFSLLDSLLLDAEEMLRGMSDKGISFAA